MASTPSVYSCVSPFSSWNCLPFLQSKPNQFQFKTIAPCPVTTGPSKLVLSCLISPLNTERLKESLLRTFSSSRLTIPNSFSLSSWEKWCSPLFSWPSSRPVWKDPCLSWPRCNSPGGCNDSREEQGNYLPGLAGFPSTKLRMKFAFWTANTDWQLLSNFSPTNIPKSFSAESL